MAFPALPPSPPAGATPSRVASSAAQWGLDKTDKWKAASHLHKAIRHGRPDDAEQAVRWLQDLDPAYLRYRLAVIAVEDVAAGSPELVAQAFAGGWTKAALAQSGPGFLVGQARAFAQATKDRTPCAWMSCTRWLGEFQQRHGPWPLLPLGRARRLAFDPSLPWWERGLAAWRAAGSNVFRSGSLPSMPGDWDAYVAAAVSLGLPDSLLACVKAGGKVQGEAHPIFLPLAAQCQLIEPVQQRDRAIPALGYAGPWLSAALDKHTSEGKRALGRLLRAKAPWVRQLTATGTAAQDVEEAVGRLWFWMEGGLLNRYLDYPTARTIDQDTKRRVMEGLGISPRELFATFGQDLPAWHAARVQAIPAPRFGFPAP